MSQRLEESAAAVLAEDVPHRIADVTDGATHPQCLLDRRQEVPVTLGNVPEGLESLVELGLVARFLECGEPLQLACLRLRVDLEDVDVIDLVADVLVDADDDVLARPVA